MAKYLYGRRVKLVLLTPHESVTFDYKQTETHSMGIQFNVPFSDSSTPPTCTVTIMNLSAKHRKLFKKGYEVKLYAGYAEDGVGLLSAGVIRLLVLLPPMAQTTLFLLHTEKARSTPSCSLALRRLTKKLMRHERKKLK